MAARLRGVLSLVNLLWAVAIGGVAVSVGPALYVLASPFQRLLAVIFLRAAAVVSQVMLRFVSERPRSGCCKAHCASRHGVPSSSLSPVASPPGLVQLDGVTIWLMFGIHDVVIATRSDYGVATLQLYF